jgi:hypothetical protein
MPGLKQLKQFSEDVSKIGNEQEIRKTKGEPFVPYNVPEGVSDIDDSDAFKDGLPSHEGKSDDKESGDSGQSPKSADNDLFIDPDLEGFFDGTQDDLPEPQPINAPASKPSEPAASPSEPESAAQILEDDDGLPSLDDLDKFLAESLVPPAEPPEAEPPQTEQAQTEPAEAPPEDVGTEGGPDDDVIDFDSLEKFLAEPLADEPLEPAETEPPQTEQAQTESAEAPPENEEAGDSLNFDDISFDPPETAEGEPDDDVIDFDDLE